MYSTRVMPKYSSECMLTIRWLHKIEHKCACALHNKLTPEVQCWCLTKCTDVWHCRSLTRHHSVGYEHTDTQVQYPHARHMLNEHSLFGLKSMHAIRPPAVRPVSWPKYLSGPTYNYFGTAGCDVGCWMLDEAPAPLEFVPDNACSNELALLAADSCCWLAINAASRRIRSCWYCSSLRRSICRRYSCSCWMHQNWPNYSNWTKLHQYFANSSHMLATSDWISS